jgi:hypothetical protein
MIARLLLAALAMVAFAARLCWLARIPEPFGTDGYYYVVQVEHLLAEGRPHVPDASWVLRLLAGCTALVDSPILGVKIGAALLAAAAVPAAFLVGRSIARSRSARGEPEAWALALWAAASPALSHLAAEFPKTLGAAAPLLLALAIALQRPEGLRGAAALAAALLLAATAHRIGAGLTAVALGGACLAWLLRRSTTTEARRMIAACTAALAVLGGATSVLPGLIHLHDLERLRIDPSPHLPAPWGPGFWHLSLAERFEIALAWPVLLAGMVAFVRRPAQRTALGALLAPLVLALLPFWRSGVSEAGYRLSLAAPMIAAPLLALAWPSAVLRIPSRAVAAVAVACGAVSPLLAGAGIDTRLNPPYAHYRALIASLPEWPALLIVHQGLSFLYGHVTWREAMHWAPESSLDRRTIGRIAWGIRPGEWIEYGAIAPAPVPLDPDYTYVREDVWEALAAGARAAQDDDLLDRIADWRNPSQMRPASLLRNR